MEKTSSHIFPFPTRLIKVAFKNSENFEYSWDAETSMILLLGMLKMFQVLFKVNQLFKNTTQRSVPKLHSHEWQGVWDSMGKHLEQEGIILLLSLDRKRTWNPQSESK